MRFLHIADVHLGYQQYGLKDRFDDFSRAFLHLVDTACDQDVDFVLLAGDLFHKRTVDPLAMRVAIAGLEQLQEAGIPVLAVEGNHEKAYYRDQFSWVDFLDAMGYLRLLNPTFKKGHPILESHGEEGGAYVDLPLDDGGTVRVYGLKYYGASTSTAVQGFAEVLPTIDQTDVRYTILMMHAGLEGQLAHVGRLKHNDLAPLREHVDYVALGHIHKPYSVDDWIYNPGSPETCGMDETQWPERGAYLVEIRPGTSQPHVARLRSTPRRPFHRFWLEVDGLTEPNAVYDAVRARIRRAERKVQHDPAPVVELTLTGVLPFNRYELDLDYVQGLLEEAWSPLTARVQSKITPADFEVDADAEASRPELERTIVQQLIERDARYRPQAEDWMEGALELKQLVLEGTRPQAIVEHLRRLRNDLALDEEA